FLTTRDSTMTPDTSPAPPAPPTPPSPTATPTVSPPVPAKRHAPFGRRWAVWCGAAAVAIVVVYLGIHWSIYRFSHSITDDAFVEAHIVNITPQMVSGRIVRFLVEENDRVENGQVL